MADRRAVEARLQNAGFTVAEPEALDVCLSLATEFGITPASLAADYEIMNSLKENCSMEVCASHVSSKAFRDFLAKQYSAAAKAPPARVVGNKQPFGNSWENVSDREAALYQPTPKRQALGSTPSSTRAPTQGMPARTPLPRTPHSTHIAARSEVEPGSQLKQTPGPSVAKFEARAAKGDLVLVLNEHIPEWEPAAAVNRTTTAVQQLGEALPVVGQHLFMTETLEVKIQAIEERLMDWADHLAAAIPEAKDAKLQSVTQITQEPTWCVGRIVLEASAEDAPASRLTASSLFLEGSRAASDGARVRLDVSALQAQRALDARFFPGAVVAVQGVNPTGHVLMAQSLCTSLPAPQAAAPDAAAGPKCVILAAGPFTTADELCFSPLDHLLQHCQARRPDVLLLLGPFVDIDHAAVQSGMLDRSLDTVFQEEVVQRLSAWQACSPNTRVVLLPSVRDAHHAPVHPTPAFALPSQPSASANATVSFPSPCVLGLPGGVAVGASSADVLKALSGCELTVGAGGMDRMTALTSHVVGQRSFFPVYPPPVGACLDLSHAAALQLTTTPHVMVLPSDLAPFAKILSLRAAGDPGSGAHAEQVLCINPGRLVRGTGAGTFAMICTQPGTGSLSSRSRVEVRKV